MADREGFAGFRRPVATALCPGRRQGTQRGGPVHRQRRRAMHGAVHQTDGGWKRVVHGLEPAQQVREDLQGSREVSGRATHMKKPLYALATVLIVVSLFAQSSAGSLDGAWQGALL